MGAKQTQMERVPHFQLMMVHKMAPVRTSSLLTMMVPQMIEMEMKDGLHHHQNWVTKE